MISFLSGDGVSPLFVLTIRMPTLTESSHEQPW
jgi:hypothetical protein